MRLGESHGLEIHVAGAVGSQREKNTWLGILFVGPVLCFDLRRKGFGNGYLNLSRLVTSSCFCLSIHKMRIIIPCLAQHYLTGHCEKGLCKAS